MELLREFPGDRVRFLVQSGRVLVMMPCWSMAKVVSLPEMVYLHTSPKVGEQSLSVASTWRSYLLQLIYTHTFK